MALCEKYKMEIPPGKLLCPDPHIYCDFRMACLVYIKLLSNSYTLG
ncbi:MAG: hypothetical protein HW382_1090 [Deltaproteobacteria bacterium]|nr:hypothetical protein [Deltaproteobacteria bacterium]MBM2837703.1 hypothetical protein [Deltaproteobacteria bacterium]